MKLLIALIIQIQVLSLDSAGNIDVLTDLNDFEGATNRVKRSGSNHACVQPPITPDKKYTVRFQYRKEIFNAKPGEEVPEFTSITSECNKDYTEDYEYHGPKQSRSVCINSAWTPPILKCKKICNKVAYFSKGVTCQLHLKEQEIPCTGILLEGAIAKPRCQKQYSPSYEYATCGADGKWDKGSFKCIPDCGISAKNKGLIAKGSSEERGGSPWYVAIYNTEASPRNPICGGTLITAELVISAAHCFYDPTYRKTSNIGNYHAVVGKMTPDIDKVDLPTTKKLKLKDIFFPVNFNGPLTNFAGDIVVLQLSERVIFSSDVFPACLDRDNRIRFNGNKNEKGKLSGFGETENSSISSSLLTADLPTLKYDECLTKLHDDSQSSITPDKFCADSTNGVEAGKGDSGGGLVFMDNTSRLYHLRGVVSNRVAQSFIVAFTDVAQYMAWILSISKTVESKSTVFKNVTKAPPPNMDHKCWDTGCQLNSWGVRGCEQYDMDEVAQKKCDDGIVYSCCYRNQTAPSVRVAPQNCWDTGCQLDGWKSRGCEQYGMKEKSRTACSNGIVFTCCTP